MREIKFRGQIRKSGEKINLKFENVDGKWVYGGVNKFDGERSIIYSIEDGKCSVYSDTVCQYTGLKDKNGKECFEGDIISSEGLSIDLLNVVYFDCEYGHFSAKPLSKDYFITLKAKDFVDCEVIGNIYENPELLKGE